MVEITGEEGRKLQKYMYMHFHLHSLQVWKIEHFIRDKLYFILQQHPTKR